MFSTDNIFNTLLVIPILNILLCLYKLLQILKIPGPLGFSLIILTVLIRFLLQPLMVGQLKSAHQLAKLKPALDKLSQKYKDDKLKLQQEQLRLYKEAGINPLVGCLPLLLQMPILLALYNLFFQLLSTSNFSETIERINQVVYFSFLKINSLDLSFLGLNLATKPLDWQRHGWWLLFVPFITSLFQYWQTKIVLPKIENLPGKDKKKKEDEEMGQIMQKQMSLMMPLMIGFFSYSLPLGLSLYWNTFTIFGIIQQYQLNQSLKGENADRR